MRESSSFALNAQRLKVLGAATTPFGTDTPPRGPNTATYRMTSRHSALLPRPFDPCSTEASAVGLVASPRFRTRSRLTIASKVPHHPSRSTDDLRSARRWLAAGGGGTSSVSCYGGCAVLGFSFPLVLHLASFPLSRYATAPSASYAVGAFFFFAGQFLFVGLAAASTRQFCGGVPQRLPQPEIRSRFNLARSGLQNEVSAAASANNRITTTRRLIFPFPTVPTPSGSDPAAILAWVTGESFHDAGAS